MTSTSPVWLESCLAALPRARVAVFGDFCVDAYWLIDPDQTEHSIETGLVVGRVRRQRYSLGGAGNVVANLAALGVGAIEAVGLAGADLFGNCLLDLLAQAGAGVAGMSRGQADWQTMVYAKPYIGQAEQSRLDFGAFNAIAPASIDWLTAALDQAAARCDAVVLNQQIPGGVSTPAMIRRINAVIAAHERCCFIVDSRHRGEQYAGAALKVNAHEAARLLGEAWAPDQVVPAEEARDLGIRLHRRTGRPLFLTRGRQGLLVVHEGTVTEVPGVPVAEPTDPVGAGDTAVATLAAVLGSGGEPVAAARLANLAASITVGKLQTTGTATPAEIRRAAGGAGAACD